MTERFRTQIAAEAHVALAVLEAHKMGPLVGLSPVQVAKLATVVAELARNILKYADRGSIILEGVSAGGRRGVEVTALDRGPGIADIDTAMEDHFSSSGTLGLGLPGVKRMVDEFELKTDLGAGTTVTARLWGER